jgi:signal transduction histidine kinase
VAQHEAALAEITEDLTRLTRMADELLELGSGQQRAAASGPQDLAAEAADVVEVRGALAPHGSFYTSPGALRLHTDGPVLVGLDVVAIRRILDNLLDNAALHGSAPVTVTVDRTDGWARLLVADCGDGMPPDLLATATDRFARSPEARSRPGSGLGLSLVATIVSTAGGQLRLCHAGHHHRVGTPVAVPCRHDRAMTITVLLPPTSAP